MDWPQAPGIDEEIHRQELIDYTALVYNTNMNAIMFQVRTTGDAFYDSPIEPWSK